ncbi:MAG: BglG family transcription antiterminator [Ileibacterium sp.]|nr:BglG family transcription antiterminator [Ileibacterium sp.]
MKSKEKELLLALYNSTGKFQTGAALSRQLDISERTVRTYIRTIEHLIKSKGALIQAKQGSGYRIEVYNPAQFESYISNLRSKRISSAASSLDSVQDRQNYILTKLLLNEEHLILDDLCEELFVSRSTLAKDLVSIKDLLRPYDLSLKSKTSFGTWVYGDEAAKRAFIMDYFFRESKFTSIREYLDHSGYFDDLPIESIIMIVMEETRKGQLNLSDVMIQNILLHVGLSIKRNQKGLKLENCDAYVQSPDSFEFTVAKNILKRLEHALNIHFPPEETAYLTLHLGVKGRSVLSQNSEQKELLRNEIQQCMQTLDDEMGLRLQDDDNLKACLLEHLLPMTARLKQNLPQANPLTEEILRDHPDALQLTKNTFRQMPSLQGFEISDDEWAYLALHMMAGIEKASQKKKIQTLVICATGVGSSQLLKNRIQKEFGDSIHIVSETGYFNMSDDILEGIDLIISSVNIGPVIFGVPFIHVSLFLNSDDTEKIRKFIQEHDSKAAADFNSKRLQTARKTALFDQYFNAESFTVFDRPVTREDVMNAMVDKLSRHEDSDNFKKHMMDQIALRNSMGSVVFSETIAVPHPAMPVSRKASLSVGIVRDGICWDETFKDVKFVFLLSPSYDANDGSHHLLNGIVNLVDSPEVQKHILEDPTFESFKKLFINVM